VQGVLELSYAAVTPAMIGVNALTALSYTSMGLGPCCAITMLLTPSGGGNL